MIILASASPRRKELLKEVLGDIPFACVPSEFDESQIRDNDTKTYCLKESLGKAMDVAKRYPEDIIIASDTMVVYKGRQLGKPKDYEDAMDMLRTLSGNTHEIVTSYVIQRGETVLKHRISVSKLFIEKMADCEIEAYLDTGSPFDKAGAYGIQDEDFIESKLLSGDYCSVMGLPVDMLYKDLVNLKIIESE